MSNPEVKQDTPDDFATLWAAETGEDPQTTEAQEADKTQVGDEVDATTQTEQTAGSGETETTTTTEATATTAAASTEGDWFAALPEDVRTRIAEERRTAEDRYNALHGRVAPVQRALSEAQAELARRSTQPAQTPAATAASSTATDSFFDSADWKQYAADFPGDAKVLRAGIESERRAVEDRIAQLESRLGKVSQDASFATQRAEQDAIQEQIAALEKEHPDWRKINASDEFWDWFDQYRSAQPAALRAPLFDEQALGSLFRDATWTAARISEFKTASGKVAPATDPPVPATAAATTTATTESAQPAQTGAARLRMAEAPEVRSAGVPRTTVPLESLTKRDAFQAIWDSTN